jgi:hypothetical protein
MMDLFEIRRIVGPLRAVFWGGIICVVDFTVSETTNGEGFRFDIINDFVGMLLITWGVYELSAQRVHEPYAFAMRYVLVVSALTSLWALHDHIIYRVPEPLAFALAVLGVASIVATVVFCVAMRWLSEAADLRVSAASWRMTTALFIVIYLIPLGFFYAASAVAIVVGESFRIDLGPIGLLLIPVFAAPLVHLLVSTARMKSEAEEERFTQEGVMP